MTPFPEYHRYDGLGLADLVRRKQVTPRDSEMVRRFKAAGLLILGKTNTPEFGLTPYTEPDLFGPTRNPWDPTRTPGGSSGGSAAAVAARMVPIAGGGDGGGSIRIPASCCGVFGLKVTRGRTPTGPDFETGTYGLGLLGKAGRASEYARAARYLQRVSREVAQFFEQYDILLTPTTAQPPVVIGALKPSASEQVLLKLVGHLNAGWLLRRLRVARQLAAKTFEFVPYTPLFNATGQPAMSVPLHWNEAGLPIGMHFVGRFGDEATLFRLAGQLERARPWFDRAPRDAIV